MNLGFANIYSFRPHVEHLYYLATILKDAGHEVFFLTCDASVSNCYARALKGTSKWVECSKCMIGGVRSFTGEHVTAIRNVASELTEVKLEEFTLSSSCTLTRVESTADWQLPELQALRKSFYRPVGATYESARRWIRENALDGVVCFNGRMELTRAVIEACKTEGIPFVTHERTWFGDGLRLIANADCLSIAAQREMVREFAQKPLTEEQAAVAGRLLALRFLQENTLEWRLYNRDAEATSWPLETKGKRILILPSSRNEFAGNVEWETGWSDNTKAIDDFLDVYGFDPTQVVLRCHPNWAETIGRVSGERIVRLYRDWARRRGVYCIDSAQKANTYDLIQQADMIVLNGGSSAVEGGACGKQVVCLGPASYDAAGFVQSLRSRKDMEEGPLWELDPTIIRRLTLRYVYVRARRFPQFTDHVRALSTTHYRYFAGADASRVVNLLQTGALTADDPVVGTDTAAEDHVIEDLTAARWRKLCEYSPPRRDLPPMDVRRRAAFRWVDPVRSLFARGDR